MSEDTNLDISDAAKSNPECRRCEFCADEITNDPENQMLACEICRAHDCLRWSLGEFNISRPDIDLITYPAYLGEYVASGSLMMPLLFQPTFHWKTLGGFLLAEKVFHPNPACLKPMRPAAKASPDLLMFLLRSVNDQLSCLLKWTRYLPYFAVEYLPEADRFSLLSSNWTKMLLLNAAFNSTSVMNGLVLANRHYLWPLDAKTNGFGPLMETFHQRLVNPIRYLDLDYFELGILRAIVLFNSGLPSRRYRRCFNLIQCHLVSELYGYQAVHRNRHLRIVDFLWLLKALIEISDECLHFLNAVGLRARGTDIPRLTFLVEHRDWPPEEKKPLLEPENITMTC